MMFETVTLARFITDPLTEIVLSWISCIRDVRPSGSPPSGGMGIMICRYSSVMGRSFAATLVVMVAMMKMMPAFFNVFVSVLLWLLFFLLLGLIGLIGFLTLFLFCLLVAFRLLHLEFAPEQFNNGEVRAVTFAVSEFDDAAVTAVTVGETGGD